MSTPRTRNQSTKNERDAERPRTTPGARATPARSEGPRAGSARTGRDAMPRTGEEMWALVYDIDKDRWDKSRGFRRERVLRPTLDANDPRDAEAVILKVKYTGFCGSDAGIWFRTSFKAMIHDSLKAEGKTTRVIGHEVLGEVVEVGAVAGAHYGFSKGDLVAAESHITCGRCHQCLINQRHVCTDERIIGISRDGGFAEYIKLPATVLWRTDPKKIRPEVAVVQEPFGNAVHASTAVDLRGKTVALFGCGAIGQFTIMIAKALGAARIIGIDPNPINAALAKKLGADEVVTFKPVTDERNGWKALPEVVDAVVKFSGSDGVDVAMEMAGYNSSVNNALHSVRRGGDVVLFGLKSGDFKIQDFQRTIVKGIRIQSVIGRRLFETWEITRNLLESKETGIQDKIWNIMLDKGRDTIVNAEDFVPAEFEKKIGKHPKLIIKW
ncbi:MAG TPA: zinc-binding dehydrogenase [Candidatus Krumholzibacteria bacterium]|nr:zinc-binding dehydrogenase [Candidatus Krumholzibacteria bacterium]